MGSTAETMKFGIGSIVANTYEIVRILGRGGMGSVWEAHHKRLPGKRVAIKVLHSSVAEDAEALARFKREAEIACRLGHANIVEVHDFNNLEDGSPYLILELLEGVSLDARLREGRLSVESCESILWQVASALQSAHEQEVIHRDLKPQNIFLVPSPTGVGPEIVKVLDFGISKIRGSQTVKTQDSTLLGTPQYMAPEQALGHHDKVDARTDIFALGAMLYELLSGVPAFGGQSIPEVVYKVVHEEEKPLEALVPGIPATKAAAIHKALNKKQDERFASVSDMALAFTGQALPQTKLATATTLDEPPNAMLGSAATVDSSKIDLAQAATVDSHSTEFPAIRNSPSGMGMDATIDSSKLDRDELAALATAPMTPSQVTDVVSHRSRTPIWLIMLSALSIAAAAFFYLSRQPQTENVPKVPPVANEVNPSAVSDAAIPETVAAAATKTISDAGTADAGTADAGTADARKAKHSKPPPSQEQEKAPIPAEAAKLLKEARSHLRSGRLAKAITLAKRANRIHKTPAGYTLQANAFCRQSDLPAFNGALRKLSPTKQRKVRKACKNL